MMQITGNTVRERILSALNSKKIKPTSGEFLAKIGFSSGTVSDYIGKKAQKEPSESFVRKICEIYNFPFEEIWLGNKTEVNYHDAFTAREFIEYLKLENERKQKLLETSLAEILSKSVAIQGHVMSLLQLEVEKAVGNDPKKQREKLAQVSKNSAANAGVLQVKDT